VRGEGRDPPLPLHFKREVREMKIEGIGFCCYSKHPMNIDEETCDFKDGRCQNGCQWFVSKEEYATVEEVSRLLNKSQATIRKWIKDGKLKSELCSYSQKYGRKTFRTNFYVVERKHLNEFMIAKQAQVTSKRT
jgi:hypothetical protein